MKYSTDLIVACLVVLLECCSLGNSLECQKRRDLAQLYKTAQSCGEDCSPTADAELSNTDYYYNGGELMGRSLCKWSHRASTSENRYPSTIYEAVLKNSSDCTGLADGKTTCEAVKGRISVLYPTGEEDFAGKCKYHIIQEELTVGYTCSFRPSGK